MNVSVSAIDLLLTNNTAQGVEWGAVWTVGGTLGRAELLGCRVTGSGGGIFMSASGSTVLNSTVSVDLVTAIGNAASGSSQSCVMHPSLGGVSVGAALARLLWWSILGNGGGAFVQGSGTSSHGDALVGVSRLTAKGNTAGKFPL